MKKRIYIQFITILIMLGMVACTTKAQESIIYKDIDITTLSMDVYYPPQYDTLQTYPAIVFFFGGGWVNGDLNQFSPQAQYFSERGAVCFVADYRVQSRHGTTPFESLKDAKSAIRFIRSHASEFRIDTAQIVAAGGSAGGHLAAATALIEKYNEQSDNLSISCVPNALLLFNPVIDNSPGGYGYGRIGDQYKDFSPLHNIRENTPPTIFFLGTEDKLIPVETAKYYQKASEITGNRCELRLYEHQKHGFFNFKNRSYYDLTMMEADSFLTSLGFLEE